MKGLLHIVASAPSSKPMFAATEGLVTAGQIRREAMDIAERLTATTRVYLYTNSASLFVASLLAAASKKLEVVCPAHMQPLYLKEIGADRSDFLTDRDIGLPGTILLVRSQPSVEAGEFSVCDALDLVFYTSGVTGKPKAVRKKISQLDEEASVLERLWPKGATCVFGTVSHQHIYGMLFRIFWPVLSDGISTDRVTEYWEQLVGTPTSGSTLVSGPAHLTRLPAGSVLAGIEPQFIFSSGAPLPFAAARAVDEQFGTLPIEVLGSTESGGIAWRQQNTEDALWRPLPGVQLGADADGRLSVRSPFTGLEQPVLTGDIVEIDGGMLRLKGRGDRIAKIDGKRISLLRVEEKLLALPNVAAAAVVDLPARKGALGVVVQLNAMGETAFKKMGAFRLSRDMRRALSDSLEPAERPKHWRFGAIPVDQQGKRVQTVLRGMFDRATNKLRGRGTVTSVAQDSAEVQIELVPEMIWFDGHFPGQPVLPGIAQVHIAALWAEHVWNWRPPGGNLSQLKFRRVMHPGDIVHLQLIRLPKKQRLKFSYRLNDSIASDGTIEDAE